VIDEQGITACPILTTPAVGCPFILRSCFLSHFLCYLINGAFGLLVDGVFLADSKTKKN
jgi:hypothetical protein